MNSGSENCLTLRPCSPASLKIRVDFAGFGPQNPAFDVSFCFFFAFSFSFYIISLSFCILCQLFYSNWCNIVIITSLPVCVYLRRRGCALARLRVGPPARRSLAARASLSCAQVHFPPPTKGSPGPLQPTGLFYF